MAWGRKRQHGDLTSPWEQVGAVTVPRPGGPDDRKSQRTLSMLRRYMRVSMWLTPVLMLSLIVAIGNMGGSSTGSATSQAEAAAARGVAASAVTAWLNQDPAPVPGATLLTWDSTTDLGHVVADPSTGTPAYTLRSVQFTLDSGTGARLTATVLIRDDDTTGVVTVAAEPSLGLSAPSTVSEVTLGQQWPDLSLDTPTQAAAQAVKLWAEAFTGGDSVALRTVIGDPDTTHTYLPLSGLTDSQVSVQGGAWLMDGNDKTSSMVARVALTLTWSGAGVPTGQEPGSSSYDVLIVDADTAAPRVVAWGAPGTGPTLVAYGNAIVGVTLPTGTPAPVATVQP